MSYQRIGRGPLSTHAIYQLIKERVMKILNRKEFLALEGPVVYAKYEPCIFGELMIRHGRFSSDDWVHQTIVAPVESNYPGDFIVKLETGAISKESIPLDWECTGRDGCFEKDQLFAVYEEHDVRSLITTLQTCITVPEDPDVEVNLVYSYTGHHLNTPHGKSIDPGILFDCKLDGEPHTGHRSVHAAGGGHGEGRWNRTEIEIYVGTKDENSPKITGEKVKVDGKELTIKQSLIERGKR